jgi:hypothetical protein
MRGTFSIHALVARQHIHVHRDRLDSADHISFVRDAMFQRRFCGRHRIPRPQTQHGTNARVDFALQLAG